jgi:ADP-heptose:LPS heptosyltransferase
MTSAATDRLPLLTRDGFGAWLAGGDAHLDAVADARRFVDEHPDAPSGGEPPPGVVALPWVGRFLYRWIAVDLGAAPTEMRSALHDALRRTTSAHGGLFLSSETPAGLPEHVHTASSVTLGDARVAEPWHLVQLARFALRGLVPTRVLFLDPRDAALFADSLDGHAVAIACSRRPGDAAEDSAAPRAHHVEVLAWLRGAGAGALPSGFADGGPAGRRAQTTALAAARAIFLGGEALEDLAAARLSAPRAGLLPASASAFASHLAPDTTAPAPGSDVSGELRILVEVRSTRDFAAAPRRAAFACLHLLGDFLAATPVVRAYRRANPDAHVSLLVPDVGYARVARLCPDVDRILYVPVDRDQLVYGSSEPLAHSLGCFGAEYDDRHVLDIQSVARRPEARGLHMSDGYARLSGFAIETRRPSIDRTLARAHRPDLGLGPRYAVLVRHTVSGRHFGPRQDHSKRWAEEKWRELARRLERDLGLDIVSIGTPEERRLESAHVLDVHCLSILQVAGLLADATLMVSVDNGVYHLGQGLGTPTVHLYPRWLGPNWVASDPDGPHVDLVADLRRLSVQRVLDAATQLATPAGGDVVARAPVAATRTRSRRAGGEALADQDAAAAREA